MSDRATVQGSLLDPEVQACPYAFYRELRTNAPVYQMPETGFYVVSTYEGVQTVVRDPATFSNDIPIERLAGESRAELGRKYNEHLSELGWGHVQTLHRTDAPAHSRHRRILNRAFTPAMVNAMVPSVERTTTQLIDAFVDRGECDFVADFAFPLPGIVIAEQIGLDPREIATFRRWADAMLATQQGLLVDDDAVRHYAGIEAQAQHYFAPLLEERRTSPQSDLMTALVADSEEGDEPLSMGELQDIMNQLVTGGYTTVADAVGNAMMLLIENPHQQALLREDRSLLRNFADEVLRLATPAQGLFRRATRDTELCGVAIPENAIIHVRYGAANTDDDVFPEPERFDITRENVNKHVAFSRGPHFCPGRPLAMQELMIGFDRLLDRIDDIALAPGVVPERSSSMLFYSLRSLPITFTARS
jgi:cytochrome P450